MQWPSLPKAAITMLPSQTDHVQLQEKRIPTNCDCHNCNWTFLSALSAGALGSQTTLNIRSEDITVGHRGILVLLSYMSNSFGSDHLFQTSSHTCKKREIVEIYLRNF